MLSVRNVSESENNKIFINKGNNTYYNSIKKLEKILFIIVITITIIQRYILHLHVYCIGMLYVSNVLKCLLFVTKFVNAWCHNNSQKSIENAYRFLRLT